MLKILIGTIVLSLAGLIVLGAWHGAAQETADKLAEEALGAATDTERLQAASKLSLHGPDGVVAMRRVLRESTEAGVRAAMLDGLAAQRDWDSAPALIDALDDADPEVQRRAASAINRLFNRDFGLQANMSPAERAAIIADIRAMHQSIVETPADLEPES